jgi:AraC-like DNA-binding protein
MNERFYVLGDGPAEASIDYGEAAPGGEQRQAGDSAARKIAVVPACQCSPRRRRKVGIKKRDGRPRTIPRANGCEPQLTAVLKTEPGLRAGPLRMEKSIASVFEKLSSEELLNGAVADLAVQFDCNLRQLNCLFRQYFGLSVVALRMEIRLCRARTLLLEKHAKVSDVAEQAGFNHVGLFIACFTKRFGVSPREWQKAGGAAPNDRSRNGTEFGG